MNKEIINQYCEQIRNEDGHTMSFGSLRTLKLIEDSVDTLINSVKNKCVEDIQQAIRYYLKYQNYPMWEDQNEYQKGVQVTCENIEELIENDFINNKE